MLKKTKSCRWSAIKMVMTWGKDYDGADREKARKISGAYLQRRLQELKAGQHNTRTWLGE